MKEISVFDVIGPNMIGPSSSHTAGALRIAKMARKIVGTPIHHVSFELFGSFAHTYQGHGTDVALVAGILGLESDDERIRDAFLLAKKQGLSYRYEIDKETLVEYPNTVVIRVEDEVSWSITGCSIGGGEFLITNINGVDIELSGEYETLFIKQKDLPGVVAHITNSLAQYHVNIAQMKLYRQTKGTNAYTIVELDDVIDKAALKAIQQYKNIDFVTHIPK